jgi:hypothetical protein
LFSAHQSINLTTIPPAMGFNDAAANIAALVATGGNVEAAIDRLVSQRH